MDYDAVVETLTFALGHERLATLTLRDGQTLVGIPTALDTHPTAFEVTISSADDPDQLLTLSLAAVAEVTLA